MSDPSWDADELQPLIDLWHAADTAPAQTHARAQMKAALHEQLAAGWDSCWEGIDHLRRLPAAASVQSRWTSDRVQWSRHQLRMATGQARFRNVPTPLQSARSLRIGEDSIARLELDMALDDPLVMAGLAAAGQALAGHIVGVDAGHTEPGPSRALCRPLIDVMPSVQFLQPAGTTLALATAPAVQAVVRHRRGDGTVQLMITKGANQRSTLGRLPTLGNQVVFSPHQESYPSPELPAEVPWTHQLPVRA